MTHTLFAFPFSCALAPHAVLRRYGVPHRVAWVDRGSGRRASSDALARANPKRRVPTLVLPAGPALSENVAVLTWLDDRFGPERPADERHRDLEWSVFVATDLHQAVLGPRFDPELGPEEQRAPAHRFLDHALRHLARRVAASPFLSGPRPWGADYYATWALDLVRLGFRDRPLQPELSAYLARMHIAPGVQVAVAIHRAERERRRQGSTLA